MNTFDKAEQARRAALIDQAQAALGKAKPTLPIPPLKIDPGPKDMHGKFFRAGQHVVRPARIGNSNGLRTSFVREVHGSSVWVVDLPLTDPKCKPRALGRPDLCLILGVT